MDKTKSSMFYGADTVIFENAKKLRNNMTFAEKKLWDELSKNRLGVRFKPQHPISSYIADFYCHKAKLVIEIDGDVHFNEISIAKDGLRSEDMEALGLRVIRFTNQEIHHNIGEVLSTIEKTLKDRFAQ